MRDIRNTRPLPARPPESEPPSGPIKPTPARELAGADPRDTPVSERPRPHAPGGQPDIAEATLAADGTTWTVRVLGRSGRAGERSPPLLLLGFWPDGGHPRPQDVDRGEHAREATVVARGLSELGPARLEDALARSTPPPQDKRRKPFFEAASQGRRAGSRRDSYRDS